MSFGILKFLKIDFTKQFLTRSGITQLGAIGRAQRQVPEVLLLSADMIRPMKTLTLIDKAKKRPKRILGKMQKKYSSSGDRTHDLPITSPLRYPLLHE